MKKSFILSVAFVLSGLFSLPLSQPIQAQNQQKQTAQETSRIKTGDKMPAFTIKSDKGNLSSADLKGKVVLVNLFATWCGPCQTELAAVEKTLWSEFKNNKDFKLLVIGREHDDAELKKYNEKKGFTFPLYPDKDRSIYNLFAESYIPRTYLIDKNGKVIYTSTGYKEEEFKELMEKIRQALQ